ncbi:MAG: hypothetical protein ACRD2J_15175 [Thermoanaerobaculia bacterium]
MTRFRLPLFLVVLALAASPLRADWVDDYEAGMKAAQAGNWQTVVQKMNSAIKGEAKENPRARPYGTVFFAYHPYYYRGIANFHLGNHEQAIADLQKTSGQGKVDLGAAGGFIARAEAQLAQQNAPPAQATPPQVVQQPPATQTAAPQPTAPAVDPNLAPARNRGRESLRAANEKLSEARRARVANRPEFAQAEELLRKANQAALNADTTADWRGVDTVAQNAITRFDMAIGQAEIAAQQQPPPTQQPAVTATEDALADKRERIRRAVEAYFAGNFRESAEAFDGLARQERDNALLWAFLGASHYYRWYLDGGTNDAERKNAIAAFQRARQHNRRLELDERYFPARVRTFFEREVTR